MGSSLSFSQENQPQIHLDTTDHKVLSDVYTEKELLSYIKEDHSASYKDKEDYINYILDKVQVFIGSTSIEYAEICFRIAELLTNDNKPYIAYGYLDKVSTILKTKDVSTISFAANFFEKKGTYLYKFRRYKESKQSLLKALELSIEDGSLKIDIYNTLGLIHRRSVYPDSAIYYFNQGLALAEETNNSRWIGIISGNLGYFYYLNKDYVRAERFLSIDNKLSLENSETESALNSTALLVEVELASNNYDLVDANMRLMDSLIIEVHDLSSITQYYKTKTSYWEHFGNYKKAYEAYRKSILYKDSTNKEFDESNLQNMIFQIKFQKKRNENELIIEKEKRKNQAFYAIAIILSVIIVACIFIIYLLRKRKRYEHKILELEKDKIQMELKRNNRELKKILTSLVEKNEIIDTLNQEISKREKMKQNLTLQKEKNDLHEKINSFTLLTENDLIEFKLLFDKIYPLFYDSLEKKYSDLTKAETRLAMLIRLNLSSLEMSRILGISQDSVRKSNLRLRKKMNMATQKELLHLIKTL